MIILGWDILRYIIYRLDEKKYEEKVEIKRMSFMKDTIFWMILFVFVILVIGIQLSQDTPLFTRTTSMSKIDNYLLNDPNRLALQMDKANEVEYFQNESTSTEVEGGASTYYKWDIPEKKEFSIGMPDVSGWSFSDDSGFPYCDDKDEKQDKRKCRPRPPKEECVEPEARILKFEECRKCDITMNQDIDKYVLKSSIPPCPDMSEYVKKNSMHPDRDMSEWIRKSDIEPCPKIDMNEFIRKSEIPSCPPPVVCPECPICPKPQPPPKCKEVNEFKITEHPEFKNYIKLEDMKKQIEKDYIKKSEIQKYCPVNYQVGVTNRPVPPTKVPTPQMWEKEQTKVKQPEGLYVGDSLFAAVA